MTLKAIKTRIYPTVGQQDKIVNNFGCCRFVWNQLLAMQSERHNNGGSYINEFGMNYLQLEYKCAWYGKQLVTVNPRKTSQICGNYRFDDGKHTLDVCEWACPKCGINHDRDINAAKNILAA